MQIQGTSHSTRILVIDTIAIRFAVFRRWGGTRVSTHSVLLLSDLRFLPMFLHCYPLSIDDTIKMSKAKQIPKIKTTNPLTPRTCHHFTPPTTCRAISSPPSALIRYVAASSQQDNGTRVRTKWIHGGDGVRVKEKPGMWPQRSCTISKESTYSASPRQYGYNHSRQ